MLTNSRETPAGSNMLFWQSDCCRRVSKVTTARIMHNLHWVVKCCDAVHNDSNVKSIKRETTWENMQTHTQSCSLSSVSVAFCCLRARSTNPFTHKTRPKLDLLIMLTNNCAVEKNPIRAIDQPHTHPPPPVITGRTSTVHICGEMWNRIEYRLSVDCNTPHYMVHIYIYIYIYI